MNRKEFLKKSMQAGLGSSALVALTGGSLKGETTDQEAARIKGDKEFIENWLVDLLDAMSEELDKETQIKLLEACGHGCFKRHEFKRNIARQGKGDLEKLLEAYRQVFASVKKEDGEVHVRFNSREHGCFCPVLKTKNSKLYTLHCNCHKGTHEAMFQEALGRPVKARIIESIRRGGQLCHFAIKLT